MFNKKLKRENEINKMTIDRLLDALFGGKLLDEEEMDILLEHYEHKMTQISLKKTFSGNINNSAKIGFKV